GFVAASVLIADAACAMGLQSAVMLRLHGGPTTTYITGTLTTFATNLVQWLDLVEKASTPGAERNANVRTTLWATDGPWVYGLTWFIYVSAAVVVGFLFLHIGEFALLVPIFAVLVVFVVARAKTVAAALIS